MGKFFPVINVEDLIKRIPRPERSGYLSVAIMLMFLYRVLVPSGGGDCGYFSLRACTVAAAEVTPEEKKRATPLYFGSGPGEADNVCHLDTKTAKHGAYCYHMTQTVKSNVESTAWRDFTDEQWE